MSVESLSKVLIAFQTATGPAPGIYAGADCDPSGRAIGFSHCPRRRALTAVHYELSGR